MDEETAKISPAGLPTEQLRKLQQAVEQSPSTVMITDTGGNIEYVNPKFFQLTGYRPEEVIGKNVRGFHLGDQPPEVYRELWSTIKAGREWRGRFHNLCKDGTPYWENVSIAPLRDPSGVTTNYIKVAEDITKVVDLEKLRDDLTDLIVHDLKNPLTGIVTSTELLLAGPLGPLTDDQKKYLELSRIGAKKLLNLIMDLLQTRKLEENKMPLLREQFKLDDLAKELSWLELLARQEKKTFAQQIDKGLTISADRGLLIRVIENLAGNAIKHTPAGGQVTLRITHDALRGTLFEVTDTGEGIPAEYLDKLFNRFFKVETQGLKTRLDTGLGLYFCKMAVEAHGGRIGVESTVGKGSRFYFTLPNK
ncbi:MAG TPA: ATP-binding protein [Candidatus Sulfotelmatobacter sp.]|nr:ATP-binding protein [Candidatus Sulfotelmatobacter sp.]